MVSYWFHAYDHDEFPKAEQKGFVEVFFKSRKRKKAMSIKKDDIIIGYRTGICRFWGMLKISKPPFWKEGDPNTYAGTEMIETWYTTRSDGIEYDDEILALIGENNMGNFVRREPNLLENGAKIIALIKKKASRQQ